MVKPSVQWLEEVRGGRLVGNRLVGGRLVREVWLKVPISDEEAWIAAYRLVPREGRPVVAEVRVFPAEKGRRKGGCWSVEDLGHEAPVPPGGVPSALLRDVKIDQHLKEYWPKIIRQIRRQYGDDAVFGSGGMASRHGFTQVAEEVRRRTGRRGHDDLFYARFASGYIDQLARRSSTPTRDLAESLHYSQSYVRDVISRARKRGLLTQSPRGRPGGQLTEKALQVLEQAGDVKKKGAPKKRAGRRT